MRCYFIRHGRIQAVEEMPGLSDEQAVEKGRELFEERKKEHAFDAFEVWERARMVIQYPEPGTDDIVQFPKVDD